MMNCQLYVSLKFNKIPSFIIIMKNERELLAPFNEFFICPAATNYINEEQKSEAGASDSKQCSGVVPLESKLRKICKRSSDSSPVESLLYETPPSVKDVIPVLKNISSEFKLRKPDDNIQETQSEIDSGREFKEHLRSSKVTSHLLGHDKDVKIIKNAAQYQYIIEKPSEYVMEEILNRCFQSLEDKLDRLPSHVNHKLDLSFILDEVLNNVFEYTKNEVIMKRARFYTRKVYPKPAENAAYIKKLSKQDPLPTDYGVKVQKHVDVVVPIRKRARENKIEIFAEVPRQPTKKKVKAEKRRRCDKIYGNEACVVDNIEFVEESNTLSTGTASVSEIDKSFEKTYMKNSLHICPMNEYYERNDMGSHKESSRNETICEYVRKKICPDYEEIRATNKSFSWSERVPSFISNILSTKQMRQGPIRAGCVDSGSLNVKLSARNTANRGQQEGKCGRKFSRCFQTTCSGTSERDTTDMESRKSSLKFTQKQKLTSCRNLEEISNRSVNTYSTDSKSIIMEKGCKCSITANRENSENLNIKKSSIKKTKPVKSVVFPEYNPDEDKENRFEYSDYNKNQSTMSITPNFRAKDSVMVYRKAKKKKHKNQSHPHTIDENYDDNRIRDIFFSPVEGKSTIYIHPDSKSKPFRKTVRMISQGTYSKTLDSENQNGKSQNVRTKPLDEKIYEKTGRLEHAKKQQAPNKISCLTDIEKSSSSSAKKNKKVFISVDASEDDEDYQANRFETSGGSPLKSAISVTRNFPVKDSVLLYMKNERKKTKPFTYPKSVVGIDTHKRSRDLSSCLKAKKVIVKSERKIVLSKEDQSPKPKSETFTQDTDANTLEYKGKKRKSRDSQMEYLLQKRSEEIRMLQLEEQIQTIPNKNKISNHLHKICLDSFNLDSRSCDYPIESGHIHPGDFDKRKSFVRKIGKIETINCPKYALKYKEEEGHLEPMNPDFLMKNSATMYKETYPVAVDGTQVDNNSTFSAKENIVKSVNLNFFSEDKRSSRHKPPKETVRLHSRSIRTETLNFKNEKGEYFSTADSTEKYSVRKSFQLAELEKQDGPVYLSKITKKYSSRSTEVPCRFCNTLSEENICKCEEKTHHVSSNNFDNRKLSTGGTMKKELVVCTKYAPECINHDEKSCLTRSSTDKQYIHLIKSTPIERKAKKKKKGNCNRGTLTENFAGLEMKCKSMDSHVKDKCREIQPVNQNLSTKPESSVEKLRVCTVCTKTVKTQDFRSHSLPLKLTKSTNNVEDTTLCKIQNETYNHSLNSTTSTSTKDSKCPLRRLCSHFAMKMTRADKENKPRMCTICRGNIEVLETVSPNENCKCSVYSSVSTSKRSLKTVITDMDMGQTKNSNISTCPGKHHEETEDVEKNHLNFSSEGAGISEDGNTRVKDKIPLEGKNNSRKKCLCCQRRRKKGAAGKKSITKKKIRSAEGHEQPLENRSTGRNVGICTEDTCLRRSSFSLESTITIKERCISSQKVCDISVGVSLEQLQNNIGDEARVGVGLCGRKDCPAIVGLGKIFPQRLKDLEASKAAPKHSKVSFSPIAVTKPFSGMDLTLGLTKVPDLEYNIEMILKEIMKKIFESEKESTSISNVNVVPNSANSTQKDYALLQNCDCVSEMFNEFRTTKEGVFHVCQKKNVLPLNFPSDLNCIFTNEYRPQFEITVEQVAKFVVPLTEILSKMMETALKLSEIEISIFDRKTRKKPGRPKTREIVVRILNYQLLFETEIFRKVSLAYGNMKLTL